MNDNRPTIAGVLAVLALAIILFSPKQSMGQQTTADKAASGKAQTTIVQFPNTPVPVILLEYERLSGKTIIRDASIQDKTLIIQTSKEMSYADAALFIEKSFLLNGYALIKTRNPDQLKIIDFNTGKMPVSEGLAIYSSEFQLPDSDEVVSYVMPISNISPEAAAKALSDIVELHPYGKITPLESANAIVITENSTVIRQLIELQMHIDVKPVITVDRSFILIRADAEEVATVLTEMLDLDDVHTPAAPTGNSPNTQRVTRAIPSPASLGAAASSYVQSVTPKAKVHAIPRANTILAIASPADMLKIENLIEHLDVPTSNDTFLKRKLNYKSVADFLPIVEDTLLRGLNSGQTQPSQISGGNNGTAGNNRTAGNTTQQNNNTSTTNNRSGSSGISGANTDFNGAGQDIDPAPISLVVGKTLLIGDTVQNTLIVTGPPEHLKVINELLDIMDIRPQQIQVSVIIAQLTLGDDFEFGFDLLRSLESPTGGRGNNGAGAFKGRTGTAQTLLDIDTLTDVANLLPAAQGLTLYGQINPYLDGFVSMLDATNRFKVLSRPVIYTVNNKRAIFQTGQRVAVPRSTQSSLNQNVGNNQTITSNIEYENVLLKVEVLPLINSNGEIILQVTQSNDSIVGSQLLGGDEIPTIGTQALGTTIIVPDGGTVLLGGLISEEDKKAESGLPLFVNIPLLGKVLGSTKDNVSRQELLVFIKPKIIDNSITQKKVDQELIDRTRVGPDAQSFDDGTDDNLPSFEYPEYDSPEKRISFFKRIFGRKKKKDDSKKAGQETPQN